MFLKFKKALIICLVMCSFVIGVNISLAQATQQPAAQVPATTQHEAVQVSATTLDDPLNAGGDFATIGNRLITGAIGTVGVLAIVAFIWGGIVWMTSGGSPERIKKGRSMMLWAVIGLFVIFGSYAILSLVFTALGA